MSTLISTSRSELFHERTSDSLALSRHRLVSCSPRRRAKPKRVETSIYSLPFELLDLILKLVHEDWLLYTLHPELYCSDSEPRTTRSRSWRELMKLFCQFPHIPAAVCRGWRDIIHTSPAYWTRPVVFVDGKDPLASLATFRGFIARSRDLPLILAVVRKDYGAKHDFQEAMNVSLVMDVILSNLDRFNDIYFHVNQSSSLPSITQFRYKSPARPNLARLALHCDYDDGPNHDQGIPRFLVASHWPPSLTTLKIDGRNFIPLAREPYTWSIVLSRLKTLSIERYHQSSDPLSLYETLELLSRLSELEVLSIRDVAFDTSDIHAGTTPVTINVCDLILEELNPDVVKYLFDLAYFSPTYLLLRNIPIDALPSIPQPAFLDLADIPVDQDIEDFLCFWDGEVLAVRGCPGFNDALLAVFAEEVSPPYHLCPSLRELHIQDCSNFSGKALRRMAEMRLDFAGRRENESFKLAHISDIYVSGVGPVLNVEDAVWMRHSMKTFVWSTVQPKGGSCHLGYDKDVPLTVQGS